MVLSIGFASANEDIDDKIIFTEDISLDEVAVPCDAYSQDEISLEEYKGKLTSDISCGDEVSEFNILESDEEFSGSDLLESVDDEVSGSDLLESDDDVITVNNWDELQYYCSLSDKDYTLRLKENTNFYPSDFRDINKQIKVNNNVRIIGSEGSYFGDTHPAGENYIDDGEYISYMPIVVPDENGKGVTLENITFKWIYTIYNPDAVFLQMGGNGYNEIRNCVFENINLALGHSSIVYLKKGDALLENCSFINCTTDFGCVSVYDPNAFRTARMVVKDCYFENNYARTEPGCINNCGVLTVYNTTFYKNRASVWAGAIHTHYSANTTIYDSNFTDNVAGWNGGAIYTYSYLTIYNTLFVGNNCTTNNGGGAIGACKHVSAPHIYVEGSYFENNANNCWSLDDLSTTGTGRGGAISLMDEGSIEVRNTTFIANSASIGTAICAIDQGSYGSPDIYIINNTFINHTRMGDVLHLRVDGTVLNVSDNNYLGNSIEFSNLNLTAVSVGNDNATLKITASLSNPSYYDKDILNKTLYDVYVEGKYVKTVNSTVFDLEFGDLDICNVYVIPTISNVKSNELTLTSTREYIFVSQSSGSDANNGISRETPVKTIAKALELASGMGNILIRDGEFTESVNVNNDVIIKGEGNSTFTGGASFTVNANSFIIKNLNVAGLNVDSFIKQSNGNLFISNCVFTENNANKIIEAYNIVISNSIFNNNDALLVKSNNFTSIRDSILLNNTEIIETSGNYDLDFNWWGNTLESTNKPIDLNINNWLVLNASSNLNALEINQMVEVEFGFYLNNGSKYDGLREIDLEISAVNGTVSDNISSSESKVIFTLSSLGDGSLTARYNGIETAVNFIFLKSNPNISIDVENIMYGDDLIVEVSVPIDASGDLTVTVSDQTKTLDISSSILAFSFSGLKADNYTVTVDYSGDDKYLAQRETAPVKVAKYDSSTAINLSPIIVDEDLIITVNVNEDATGDVSLYINNQMVTLALTDATANYTISSIRRGDYIIRAVYNGDDKYSSSEAETKIEVDNIEASMEISAENITYGQTALIQVSLNGDATGNVTVTIDGVSNTSSVANGQVGISLSNLDAGTDKEITVFYTGDDNYYNKTETIHFTINKADLTFEISSSDIKIGQDAIVHIVVPPKTGGNFTIGEDVISVPLSGDIYYVLSDLDIGDYEITAIYNGNNYNTVADSTQFSVLEYPTPQWANVGGDSENSGKSPYESQINGEIASIININAEIINDIVIDSEGNIYVVTAEAIYSFDKSGNQRWLYASESVEGNFSGLAIGRDVIVSPKSGDTLYFINQDDGTKYGSSNIYQGSSLFAPVIDANANLYIASEYQVSSNSYNLVIVPYNAWARGGAIKLLSLGNNKPVASPVVGDDIIVVLCENRLLVYDLKTLKSIFIKSGNYSDVRPVIGEGNVVYAILGDSIVAYASSGAQLWKTKVTGGAGNHMALDDLGLYASNANGSLYRYDLMNGAESYVSNLGISTDLLIDKDSNLYFGSNDMFYKIASDGTVLWKSKLGNAITGKPVMDANGTIYVRTVDNLVYALVQGDLRDPNLSISVDGDILRIVCDDCCVGTFTSVLNGKTYETSSISLSALAGGTYTINVTYNGDLRFAKATKSFNFTYLETIRDVSVSVKDNDVTFSLPSGATGSLSIKVNGKTYAKTLVGGKASITLPDGSYNAVITYSGDSKYAGFTITKKVSVKKQVVATKKASKIVAKNKTFKRKVKIKKYTVTLKSGKTLLKKVKLTIKVNKKTYKATTNAKGKATFKIKKLTKKGKYTAVIKFAGNKKYKASSKKVKITIK